MNNLFILIIALNVASLPEMKVEDYKAYYAFCNINGGDTTGIAIRKFTKKEGAYVLLINPYSLQTSVAKTSDIFYVKTDMPEIRRKFENSNYVKALIESEKNAPLIQNAGISRFPLVKKGLFLTADLCPSSLPIEKEFFNILINKFSEIQKPVPIGLSVTGSWMEKHRDDINWLVSLSQKGLLSITWINHSYYHKTHTGTPLKNNFLLTSGTDIEFEVLNTEKKMLDLGLVPSVFFRFPGLISDLNLFLKITGYGLIPIGSNAWLAKNQIPETGSVILVHANGNEPAGISRLTKFLEEKRNDTIKRDWLLYELRDGIAPNIK